MNPLHKLSRQTKTWLLLILFGVGLYEALEHLSWILSHVQYLLGVFLPFFLGIAFAWILDIPVRFLGKHGMENRTLRVVTVLLFVLLVIALLVGLVVPQIQSSAASFMENLDGYLANLDTLTNNLSQRFGLKLNLTDGILQTLLTGDMSISTLLETYSANLLQYGRAIGSGVVTAVASIFFCIYILFDKERLVRQLKKACRALIPQRVRLPMNRIYRLSAQMLSDFLVGKVLDSLVIGVLTAIVMSILQIPFTPLIALVVGISNIIPIFGPIIGGLVGGVILLLARPGKLLVFLILILAIQQLDGQIIGPKILGKSVGLSTMWTLFAIFIGGELFGIPGMILGAPVFSVVYTLSSEFINARLNKEGGEDGEGKPAPSGKSI